MKKNILMFVSTLLLMISLVSCPQDPDALPKGVYRLTIKGGASLEQDKEIYYSTSENEWYTSKEITDANKLASKKLYGDKVPEGYSFVIKFNDENEKPIVGEKVAFTGAKAGDTVVLDSTGELKLASLTESKTAVLSFASPTSEPTAQALPYKEHKDNSLFLGWGVNSDETSTKALKAETKRENIVVPYTPKKGESITLDSSWASFSTPSGAYSYKAGEKEKALETFQKNYTIAFMIYNLATFGVEGKDLEGTTHQEYNEGYGQGSHNYGIGFFDNVRVNDDQTGMYFSNINGSIGWDSVAKTDNLYEVELYADISFKVDKKSTVQLDEKYELVPTDKYTLKCYYIGTKPYVGMPIEAPNTEKTWVIENGKSYSFKDVDLTPDIEIQDPQKPTVPNTPEPSDSNKATLSGNEKYLVKNVLTHSYYKRYEEEGVKETYIYTGAEASLDSDVLKNGTFKMQLSKNAEKVYASGLLNYTKMEVQFNSVTKDGVSYASSIDDYSDESFLKIDGEYFGKNTDEFKQMAGLNVTTKSEKVKKASNLIQMCMRADKVEKVVYELEFSLVSDPITGNDVVSDIKVTSNSVVEYSTGTDAGGEENLPIPIQGVFNEVTVEYKEKSGENTTDKTLKIDSANVEFKKKSSEGSSSLIGVKKGSEIKIGGKVVKLSELFDTEIKANPNFIYE